MGSARRRASRKSNGHGGSNEGHGGVVTVMVRLAHDDGGAGGGGAVAQELLVVQGMSPSELACCLAAVRASGDMAAQTVVAVRHATQGVVYPLSLLARAPERFTDGEYEVLWAANPIALGEGGHDDDEEALREEVPHSVESVRRRARGRHHVRGKKRDRGRTRRRGQSPHVGRPEFVDTSEAIRSRYASSSVAAAETESDHLMDIEDEDEYDEYDDTDVVTSGARYEEGDSSDFSDDDGEVEDGAEEDEDKDEDDEELLRELDLTDFELPQLVHVMTQACPRGEMDRATFDECLDKILSQSGRYDPLAHRMFSRLFEIFDADSEGVIDVAEFLGGVSVFVSGARDEKIRFTFDLYDTDHDGFISCDEMTKYLTAVFIVIAETSPELFQQQNVDPVELGAVTAQQCFQEAAVPIHGHEKLSFEAFRAWYSQPGPRQLVAAAATTQKRSQNGLSRRRPIKHDTELTLDRLRELTGLDTLSADDLFSQFSAAAARNSGGRSGRTGSSGALTRAQFKSCFQSILKKQGKKSNRLIVQFLDRLFNAFDSDGNDLVDFIELGSGLSILCSGSRDEKVVAAFSLFDSDGDGYITREEMKKYLTSVFHVLFETNASTKHAMAVDAAILAQYTTAQAFAEADLDNDSLLSLDEFRKWYCGAGIQMQSALNVPRQTNATTLNPSGTNTGVTSIDRAAVLTGLRDLKPGDLFERLATKVNEDGMLSRSSFHAVFDTIVVNSTAALRRLLDGIFVAFDTDQDGFVDFCELSSGMTVLCAGTEHDKVHAAFTLFDINQDGFITRDEMETYLASVFRVMATTSPDTVQQLKSGDVSIEELASVTANAAFQASSLNSDGRLSLNEFTNWYSAQSYLPGEVNHSNGALGTDSTPSTMLATSSRAALKEMRELTNLGAYDVNDVFEFFEASADRDGNVSKPAFFRCFHKLLAEKENKDTFSNGTAAVPSMQAKTRQLLVELFELFDTDGNGVIDVQELGAGLSILCGGDRADRAKSLFTLYDVNHDGFISPTEMTAYLTSVFKLLYKASPELHKQTGMTAPQLAVATTTECFRTCDHNRDYKLSYDEFHEWVQRQKSTALIPSDQHILHAPVHARSTTNEPSRAIPNVPPMVSALTAVIPVDVATKLTGLNNMSLEKVAHIFSSAANERGLISRKAFDNCFYQYLCADTPEKLTAEESTRVHEVIDRLFTAFDSDQNGLVDFHDLSSGISILCSGTSDDKVRAAFDLYDVNGDGHITEDEMVHYLRSVFKLLYALDPTRPENLGISADDLAIVTAAEIFADADANHDGKLTFDEFAKWYSQPQQDAFNAILAPLDLDEVRKLTNLGTLDVDDVFERFAEHANEHGVLSRAAFDECFDEIIESASHPRTDVERLRARVVADRLFDVFDRDGDASIDFSELASGLSVLCKGARDAKVKAAFRLYDFNGDGFISLDEMTRYLTSIFKVLYEVQPQMQQETGVSAEELGTITAEQAFLEADLNRDGQLSYDEFLTWYTSPSQAGIRSEVAKNAIVDSSLRWMPLNEVKHRTHLARYEPEQVFEIFAAEANKDGLISREAFTTGFYKIVRGDVDEHGSIVADPTAGTDLDLPLTERAKINEVINGLFDLFDTDHSGFVDFGELASGLSVLCGGTKDQKVQAAFALFDFNGDGFISIDEMTRYLTAVFRVLYQVSPDTQQIGVSPEELGKVTAQQAFAEADQDHDGRLTFEEFQEWYQQPGGIGEVAKDGEPLFSLAEARRLMSLDALSAMEVFEALADCADDHGYVSKDAFDNCFRRIIAMNQRAGAQNEGMYSRITAMLDRLFALFDVEGNGLVDFSEISSGLSVFCGGTSDERVRAAFSLYDYNGDGFISLDEMTQYLTAIFKVLNEASPEVVARVQQGKETAEELGARTAKQAFGEADRDMDGRLSFEEFREWYKRSNTANMERLIENTVPEWLSFQEVRRLTNLGSFTPSEVFETFASFSSTEGTLNKDAFRRAFAELKTTQNGGGKGTGDEDDRLRVMVDRLFALFDADSNGVVDFSELASGLSVLCGGTDTDKVRAAFNLYDVNHDGFISLGEMRLYLTSVFKVLFEVNPDTEARMGISPDELGAITAEQAFTEADHDGDGRLSFEEFREWYMHPGGMMSYQSPDQTLLDQNSIKDAPHEENQVSDWVSIEVVKEMTHLERYAPNEVFEVFANRCSEDGTISRDSFEDCFEELIDVKFRDDEPHLARLRLILDRLFAIFDTDGNGVVDFCELSSGLTVLCGGSREDKVRSAFALYDLNQDGYISLDEMVRYLMSVFKVLYETNMGTKDKLGVSADELAVITAEQCFMEADLNKDGRLSFEEFVRWYTKSPGFEAPAAGVASLAMQRQQATRKRHTPQNGINGDKSSFSSSGTRETAATSLPRGAPTSEETLFPTSKLYAYASENSTAQGPPSSVMSMNSSSMESARRLLKLDSYEVNDVFEIFAEAAPSGELTFASFKKCFDQIIKLAGGYGDDEEKLEAEQMIRRLFRVFDTDKSNTVDFGELASGLSVLSGSSMDDKVRAAFQLYDINGDGFISLEEMTSYMTSIFKVMYETSDNAKDKMGVNAEELAKVTATQCFKEADLNHDNKLSFDEFKKWCAAV